MHRMRSRPARAVLTVLATLLGPLLVAAASWHTCQLAGLGGAGPSDVRAHHAVHADAVHPCLACVLSRRVSPPAAAPIPGPSVRPGGAPVPARRAPGSATPARLLPPGRASPSRPL